MKSERDGSRSSGVGGRGTSVGGVTVVRLTGVVGTTAAIATAVLIAAIAGPTTAAPAAEHDIHEVIHKMDELYRSGSSFAEVTMEIVTPHWQRTLEMKMWTSGLEKTFIRILSPRKEKGMGTLRVGNETDQTVGLEGPSRLVQLSPQPGRRGEPLDVTVRPAASNALFEVHGGYLYWRQGGFRGPFVGGDGMVKFGYWMHRPLGAFVAAGPGISTSGEVREASVLDIAPTVLALFGEPVGRDMDGLVMREIMDEDFLASHDVSYVDTYETGEDSPDAPVDSPLDERIREELRALGYIN